MQFEAEVLRMSDNDLLYFAERVLKTQREIFSTVQLYRFMLVKNNDSGIMKLKQSRFWESQDVSLYVILSKYHKIVSE